MIISRLSGNSALSFTATPKASAEAKEQIVKYLGSEQNYDEFMVGLDQYSQQTAPDVTITFEENKGKDLPKTFLVNDNDNTKTECPYERFLTFLSYAKKANEESKSSN